MVGGRLPSANAWTVSLLTNREVLAVDQHAIESRPVVSTDKVVVWRAKSPRGYYVAVFNVSSETQKISYSWGGLGLQGANYRLRDLWEHKDLGNAASLSVELPSHASILYSVTASATRR